jgi:hypothetical protein
MAITIVIGLIQWVTLWFKEEPNETLYKFGQQLTIFQTQISAYISFQSDEKVFPFTDWPDAPKPAVNDTEESQP